MQDIQVIDNELEFTVTVDDATLKWIRNQGMVDGTITIEGPSRRFLDKRPEENKANIEPKR